MQTSAIPRGGGPGKQQGSSLAQADRQGGRPPTRLARMLQTTPVQPARIPLSPPRPPCLVFVSCFIPLMPFSILTQSVNKHCRAGQLFPAGEGSRLFRGGSSACGCSGACARSRCRHCPSGPNSAQPSGTGRSRGGATRSRRVVDYDCYRERRGAKMVEKSSRKR